MIDFEITRDRSGVAIVTISGELKASNCGYFFDCVRDLIDEGYREIIIDCEDIGFVSSHAWGKLVAARRSVMKNGGYIYLVYLKSNISEALSLLRLDRLFGIYSSMSIALRKVKRRLIDHPMEPVESNKEFATTFLMTN